MATVQLSRDYVSSIPGPVRGSYRHDLASARSTAEDDSDSSVYEDSSIDISDSEDMMSSTHASGDDAPPELPTKSAMRVKRFLAGLPHKLDTIERPMLSQTTPHDLYLSSEEDASSGADDSSDYYESDDDVSSPLSERGIQESTARAVSVVFSGKPCIVDLSARVSEPASEQPSFAQRMSIIAVSSSVVSIAAAPRPQSSATLQFMDKPKPLFLESDPFPSSADDIPRQKSMFRKSLKLVKKRSSSRLSQIAASSRDSVVVPSTAPVSDSYGPSTPHPSRRRVLSGFSAARGIKA